jgi:hypothetical protein
MFEKIGRAAERAAGSVSASRRNFLGWLGRGALAAAGLVGGLLLLPRDAQAAAAVNLQCNLPYCGCEPYSYYCRRDMRYICHHPC